VTGREAVLDRLSQNVDDLYVFSNPPEEEDVVVQRILANPLMVFARAGHPLARERKIPFLGLCLGLQCAVIEFARNVCGLEGANSAEFDPATSHPVIDLLPEQKNVTDLGGSMRLGAQPCHVVAGTRAAQVYGEAVIYERHRHRYEVNPAYHEILSGHGLVFSGLSPDGRLVEIVELADHPFFLAGQFHPELRSRPTRPHPLFRDFVGAARALEASGSEREVVIPG